MTGPGLFPSLGGWMAGTPTTHPLRELFDAASAADTPTSPRRMILAAFDTIISRLEAAQPLRLAAELKDFRNARTSDDLRIVRSELVAGGMLAAAGVGFDFGARGGTPHLISSCAKPASASRLRTGRSTGSANSSAISMTPLLTWALPSPSTLPATSGRSSSRPMSAPQSSSRHPG